MGYWLVDDYDRYEDIDCLCDRIFDEDNYDDDEAVEEYINDNYSDQRVEIGGCEFYPAEIVRNCDDSLWNELANDWRSSQAEWDRDEYYGTLNSMEDGDDEWINGFHIEYHDDEEDDDDDEEEEEEKEKDEEEELVIKTLMDHFQHIY